jgi:phosphotransferase system enzyme I (PtsI)
LINKELEIKGTVISPGIAIAPICHYQAGSIEQTAFYVIEESMIKKEIERVNLAISNSKYELKQLYENIKNTIGKNEAKIFETHILILDDKQVISKILNKIKDSKINAEYAIKETFEEYEEIFAKMDNEYLKDRGTDFSEIKRRLLSHLTGETGKFLCNEECLVKESGRIIATAELTPSMIGLMKDNDIKGFITITGGENSHAAILSRAAKIPYISGINLIEKIKCGSLGIIDGINKMVIFNPREETVNKYELILDDYKRQEEIPEFKGPTVKINSQQTIELYANIMNIDDISNVEKYNFAGIGLVRSEFLFFENGDFPTISEQTKVYNEILTKLKNKPVTFRLFDFGGDKKIKSLKFPEEENPLLGLRGIRYLMKYKKILTDQVEAICMANKMGNAKILIPMISNINELGEVLIIIKEITDKYNSNIPVGMMFEVPSVFIDPVPFLQKIDFASIGSNDLVQYLFGVDRNNALVSSLYIRDSDIVFKLIDNLIIEANKLNIEVSLCREIDYDSTFLERIIKSGITKLSISPLSITEIFKKIKQVS